MKLICEYMSVASDGTRRQLFTVHFIENEDFIYKLPGLPSTLEVDPSRTLNSRYLPDNPIKVLGCIDYKDRYRYFYLYDK